MLVIDVMNATCPWAQSGKGVIYNSANLNLRKGSYLGNSSLKVTEAYALSKPQT